tara:strand:- start:1511 stop:2122 length:612 start_codon:yes stop_codon:yes gene_type:complete
MFAERVSRGFELTCLRWGFVFFIVRAWRLVMPTSKLSDLEWLKIRGDYEAGLPHVELAVANDISVHTLRSRAKRDKWGRDLKKLAAEKLDRIKNKARRRVEDAERDAITTLQRVLEDHKNVSLDLSNLLKDTIDELKAEEFENLNKKLYALKTASEVSTTLMKNQRKTWNMDDHQKGTMLEELLDEIEEVSDEKAASQLKVVD